ncbi:hypothetical protein SRABI96_02456 [Peribacillus sp. Bi96]|uniref:hypothetical protein n=1 Tax=Peribacillus sp. Bi96 TaxID=2884273 RepID=UPI001E04295D|nr:hypothetical protein [Peribacillus sp. Bi96]CAH0222878.1 hypothetical protein SRABI96_02456 [Peribacillus sp. Bi96]
MTKKGTNSTKKKNVFCEVSYQQLLQQIEKGNVTQAYSSLETGCLIIHKGKPNTKRMAELLLAM